MIWRVLNGVGATCWAILLVGVLFGLTELNHVNQIIGAAVTTCWLAWGVVKK